MPPSQILHGAAARAALLVGVDAVADAVRVTLGPAGRTVLVRRSPDRATGFEGGLAITDDGVTIAREVVLREPFAEQGAQFLRDAARATNDAAGDGTTTTTVLAQAMLRDAVRAVEAGISAVALRRGIERAVAQAIEHLRAQAVAVTTPAADRPRGHGRLRRRRGRRDGRSRPSPSWASTAWSASSPAGPAGSSSRWSRACAGTRASSRPTW